MTGFSDERPRTSALAACGARVPVTAPVRSTSPSVFWPVITSLDLFFLHIFAIRESTLRINSRGQPHVMSMTKSSKQQAGRRRFYDAACLLLQLTIRSNNCHRSSRMCTIDRLSFLRRYNEETHNAGKRRTALADSDHRLRFPSVAHRRLFLPRPLFSLFLRRSLRSFLFLPYVYPFFSLLFARLMHRAKSIATVCWKFFIITLVLSEIRS
jgi:hypothetical protein